MTSGSDGGQRRLITVPLSEVKPLAPEVRRHIEWAHRRGYRAGTFNALEHLGVQFCELDGMVERWRYDHASVERVVAGRDHYFEAPPGSGAGPRPACRYHPRRSKNA